MTIKERPIALSPFDVRAIIAGRKSQLRLIGEIQSPDYTEIEVDCLSHATKGAEAVATYRAYPGQGSARWAICACPYGVIGDRLWVQENWAGNFSGHVSHRGILYEATAATDRSHHGYWAKEVSPGHWVDHYDRPFKWESPLSMPRPIARIFLEITDIRAQRLQDISEDDAKAEGVEPTIFTQKDIDDTPAESEEGQLLRFLGPGQITAKFNFQMNWDEVNGNHAPWNSNPWVWVITFKSVEDISHG